MSLNDKISITITGLGEFSVTANEFDRTIAHYLPASTYDLRRKINMHESYPPDGKLYDHLMSATELLMVLAHFDSNLRPRNET